MILSLRPELYLKIINLVFKESIIPDIDLFPDINILLNLSFKLIYLNLDRYVLILEHKHFFLPLIELIFIGLGICHHLCLQTLLYGYLVAQLAL